MTHRTRHLMVGVMITGLAGAAWPARAEGVDEQPIPHVRSTNASIVALISLASQQSKTFRTLVETIAASNGIVYVERGHCRYGERACLVSVTTSGTYRMLRVLVETRQVDPDLMASIGHELRHAIEVLSDRTVSNRVDLYFFYTEMGAAGAGRSFETRAAVEAGEAIRAEVQNYRKERHCLAHPRFSVPFDGF